MVRQGDGETCSTIRLNEGLKKQREGKRRGIKIICPEHIPVTHLSHTEHTTHQAHTVNLPTPRCPRAHTHTVTFLTRISRERPAVAMVIS